MAITFKEKKEKQRYLIFAFLGVIFLIFLVFHFGFSKKGKPAIPPVIYQPPKIEINFELLKTPFLKELLPFEEIKPFEGKIGRENPFLPYSFPTAATPTAPSL